MERCLSRAAYITGFLAYAFVFVECALCRLSSMLPRCLNENGTEPIETRKEIAAQPLQNNAPAHILRVS
jgi:hypothetical protein